MPVASMGGRSENIRTSLLLRDLPASFSQKDLLDVLNRIDLRGDYDFVYLPVDVNTGASFGYAHVNFVDAATAERARLRLEEKSGCHCIASWHPKHQGFEAMVTRFASPDLPIFRQEMPEDYRPAIFSRGRRATDPQSSRMGSDRQFPSKTLLHHIRYLCANKCARVRDSC